MSKELKKAAREELDKLCYPDGSLDFDGEDRKEELLIFLDNTIDKATQAATLAENKACEEVAKENYNVGDGSIIKISNGDDVRQEVNDRCDELAKAIATAIKARRDSDES